MKLNQTPEFTKLCKDIVNAGRTEEAWGEMESSDMFQSESFSGGFDADERAFCFETNIGPDEYWFQLSLPEVTAIAAGENVSIEIRRADDHSG